MLRLIKLSILTIALWIYRPQIAGGQNTWQIVPTNTTLSLLGLQCLGADTLIVFGEDGILLKSMDGGETFTIKQNISASVYTAAYFKNVDTGFAGTGYGSLLRTVNGGSNWTFTGTCTCFITGICFSDDQHGIFGGTAGVYRTVDGGASWFESTNIPYFVPNRIAAFQDSVFVAIYGPSFYRSSDYGTIWSKDTVNSYSNYSLSGLSFIDEQHGYTISGDGHLFTTSDLGISWSFLAATGISNVSTLLFIDTLTGYLVAGQNYIYKTNNGGLTWTFDYAAPSLISALDADHHSVFAVGQNGMFLRKGLSTGIRPPLYGTMYNVYPNPATDEIFLSGIDRATDIAVYNFYGMCVQKSTVQPGGSIDISLLPDGIYGAVIITAAQQQWVLFAKQ